MCGFCGVLEFDGSPVEKAVLERMAETLRHRGPDDTGIYRINGIGLGNQRLAVLDLSPEAHLPMQDETADTCVAFNGEIYNYLEWRKTLIAAGEGFRSRGDVEVLLRLYRLKGLDFLPMLDGMFAFALWDNRIRQLLLVRDRMGKKPLFYYRDSERMVFGSEIKALIEHPEVPRTVNRKMVPYYLGYGYVPTPETIYEGIVALPPGGWVLVRNGTITRGSYWSLPTQSTGETPFRSEAEATEAVLAALREAVRKRLVSDVPLGAFLSGGLDSSAVVALMHDVEVKPLRTFTIGLAGESSYDELPYARSVVHHINTEHQEFVVQAETVSLLPKLVWHLDQPFGDSSAIPTYLVSREARKYVKVALTGDGGDELFAGYERFRAARLAENYRRFIPQRVHTILATLVNTLPQGTGYRDFARRAWRFVESARYPLPVRYLRWVAVMSEDMVSDLLTEPMARGFLVEHFHAYFHHDHGDDPLPQLLDVNLRSYLLDDLLVKADRMSMAASLETRSPFLDYELVELAARIPPDWKYRGGTSKHVLKRALRELLPRSIIHRKKHGFGVPIGKWFRTDLRDYIRQILLGQRTLNRGWFRPEALRQLVSEHQSGVRDHGHALWTLLMFELWHRVFLEGEEPHHDS